MQGQSIKRIEFIQNVKISIEIKNKANGVLLSYITSLGLKVKLDLVLFVNVIMNKINHVYLENWNYLLDRCPAIEIINT